MTTPKKRTTKKSATKKSATKKPATKKPAAARKRKAVARARGPRPLTIAKRARKILEDKHGQDCLIVDVREVSTVADYFLVVSGSNRPHIKAMYEEVRHVLSEGGVSCYRKTGDPESGWLVLDYVDVIIHILLDESRQYYAFEDLWATAPRVE
jgi:ribosome-associated protein